MDDPARARELERRGDLARQAERERDGERALPRHVFLEGLALHELHDDVEGPLELAPRDDADDVRVDEHGGHGRLAQEALAVLVADGDRGLRDLDGEALARPLGARLEDGARRARADPPDELVARDREGARLRGLGEERRVREAVTQDDLDADLRLGELQDVARRERGDPDLAPVEEGPVRRPEVLHLGSVGLEGDRAVAARDARVEELDVRLLGAPEDELARRLELDRPALALAVQEREHEHERLGVPRALHGHGGARDAGPAEHAPHVAQGEPPRRVRL